MSTINFKSGLLQMVKRINFPFNTLSQQEITLDEYFREIYTEPTLMLISTDGASKSESKSAIKLKGQKLVLTGAMGAGKSTYLLWLYEKYKASLENEEHPPIIFSLPQYFENENIRKMILERKDELVLFVDSLDETVSTLDRVEIFGALDIFLDCPSVIIACRSPFFYDLFNEHRRSRLDNIIQLEPLTEERQKSVIKKYLNSPYLKKFGTTHNPENTAFDIITKCRKQNVAETTIIATPLFSALASIVAVNQSETAHKLKGVIDVYREFVGDIVNRKFKTKEDLNKLAEVAFKLNTAHLERDTLTIDEISLAYGESFTNAFKDLVQTKDSSIDNSLIIKDFSHRSVGEYLLAKHIVTKMVTSELAETDIPIFFGRLFNYEVSFFIRSLFDQMNAKKKATVSTIFKAFITKNLITQEEIQILTIHNCMYFSRFLLGDWKAYATEVGEDFFSQRKDISPLILGTFLSGAISSGAITVQVQFLKASMSSENTPLVNRNLNYYLFYYGDSEYSVTKDFIKDISENTSWDNTRSVLLDRLRDNGLKKRLFRCHDLIILRQFLGRTKKSVPSMDIDVIRKIISDRIRLGANAEDPEIHRAILEEIEKIEILIEPLANPAESKLKTTPCDKSKYIISIAPNWGYEEGGVNAFNFDLNLALAKFTKEMDYQVVCITYARPLHDMVKELETLGGQVKSLYKSNSNPSDLDKLQEIKSIVNGFYEDSHLIFVGHDVFTGELAVHLANQYKGRSTSVVFHHMDYESYYAIKGDNKIDQIKTKTSEQKKILSEANIVIGIGPKLFASAKSKTNKNKTECHQLIPGLQSINPREDEQQDKLMAITFGRYDERTDNLKQMKLAATAFVSYVSKNREEAKCDATLKIIGLSSDEEANKLREKYQEQSNGYVNVVMRPYDTNRTSLFEEITCSSMSMMLSTHEGFGLVGLESIAAGVPLILSRNTGLFQFLEARLKSQNLMSYGIYPVTIIGSNDGTINDADQNQVVSAISEVWGKWKQYKLGIIKLRALLSEEIPWDKTCIDFIHIIESYIKKKKGQNHNPKKSQIKQSAS